MNDTDNSSGDQDRLRALERDKDKLEEALGVSSADDIIAMVKSLEAQLVDLYKTREDV